MLSFRLLKTTGLLFSMCGAVSRSDGVGAILHTAVLWLSAGTHFLCIPTQIECMFAVVDNRLIYHDIALRYTIGESPFNVTVAYCFILYEHH